MTSGRFRFTTSTLLATLGLLSSPGCGSGARGCIECPPMEGRYTVDLGDGGLPSACTGLPVALPTGPLEVTRTGSGLGATLDGMTLRGTLYETYDFNLAGSGSSTADGGTQGPDSASLAGRYVPALGDGGVPRLVGTWTGSYSGAGTGSRFCTVTRSLTATRQ